MVLELEDGETQDRRRTTKDGKGKRWIEDEHENEDDGT